MTLPPFIHDDFLLSTKSAQRLYHEFAESHGIIDYHCHLPPNDIAENRQFNNLFEILLEGDHYKWRALRANGVAERFCTGDASPEEKFKAWAATVPHTLGNPLYHWTHLELVRYFGITELLNERSADRIWKTANEQLATPQLTTQGILKRFRVETVCTTDDPADDLGHHIAFAKSGMSTRVLPTFRPDASLAVHRAEFFNAWLNRLRSAAGIDIRKLDDLLAALVQRLDFFHAQGCRLSDHGLDYCPASACSEKEAGAIFAKAIAGQPVTAEEQTQYASFIMLFLGRQYAKRSWTMQLHLGALRNNNSRLFRTIGPDKGFDSIGDFPQAVTLSRFLDSLDNENKLPRTILYNNNPIDNYVFATMIGNFQDGTIAGKVQFGSGWWYLDQKEGMEWQMKALANLGLLSRFVGMVTDSRSFMSYPRHEYFRRTLCNLLGSQIDAGEIPADFELVGSMVRGICHDNAQSYFGFLK
jgi:glucuronate isomerase